MMDGWIDMRCRWKLKGRLHPKARIIEIACQQGRKTRRGTHAFDWFDAGTGRKLHYLEVRFRLALQGEPGCGRGRLPLIN